jgi:hypothetical protein
MTGAAAGEIREGRVSHLALSFFEALALGCRAEGVLLGAAAVGIPLLASSPEMRAACEKLPLTAIPPMGPFPATAIAAALLLGLLGGPAILALHHLAAGESVPIYLLPFRHPLRTLLAGATLGGAWLGRDLLGGFLRGPLPLDSDLADSIAAQGVLLVTAAALLAAGETLRSFREETPRFRWLGDAGIGAVAVAGAVFVPAVLFAFLLRLPIGLRERPAPILDRFLLHPFDALLTAFAVLWFLRYLHGVREAREAAGAS